MRAAHSLRVGTDALRRTSPAARNDFLPQLELSECWVRSASRRDGRNRRSKRWLARGKDLFGLVESRSATATCTRSCRSDILRSVDANELPLHFHELTWRWRVEMARGEPALHSAQGHPPEAPQIDLISLWTASGKPQSKESTCSPPHLRATFLHHLLMTLSKGVGQARPKWLAISKSAEEKSQKLRLQMSREGRASNGGPRTCLFERAV